MSDFGQTPPQRRKEHYVFYLHHHLAFRWLRKGADGEERLLKVKDMEIVILLLSLALGRVFYDKNEKFREFIDKEDYNLKIKRQWKRI